MQFPLSHSITRIARHRYAQMSQPAAAEGARRLVALAAATSLTLTLSACADETSESNQASDAHKKVSFMLSWAPDTNHIGVYVAKSKGWYQDLGFDVDILGVAQAGAEQAVNTKLADFALSNLTNVSMVNAKGAQVLDVMQVQYKPSAIWCGLKANEEIQRPKDLDGKVFATFGSNESDAVIRRMIQTDGGKGEFDKVTVGTSTFQTLESGRADFGGFYETWEGVQSELHGPALTCFKEPDYGVPGNADSLGIITSQALAKEDPELVRKFVDATARGYQYAYEHPDEAARILVDGAPDANLNPEMVKRSMHMIVDGKYWTWPEDSATDAKVQRRFGAHDTASDQAYFDFLAESGSYEDAQGARLPEAPKATELSTDEFLPDAR